MNEDAEFGYKARQILNQGVDALDREVAGRLHRGPPDCLEQAASASARICRLRESGRALEFAFFSHARNLLAVMALTIGATGTYYWNAFEQAREYEEIDSALLVDELPPSAYLDRGFHAWLERASDSSSQ
jgi:hypothetical protein